MNIINYDEFVANLAGTVSSALKCVDEDAVCALKKLKENESEKRAAWALEQIVLNAEIAVKTDSYPCQDTGLSVFFVEIGSKVSLDFDLNAAINEATRIGYKEARKSVADPLTRLNTNDNTPAIIYTDIIYGSTALKVSFLAKGAGSENMSKVYMLTPSKGQKGIVDAVIDCVKSAGANPCPPIMVGVGVGGSFEKCALMAKKALLRPVGCYSVREDVANLEREILEKLNNLKIGAMGLGGNATSFWVAMETHPTHIGMLPVAINIQCHSVRHSTLTLVTENT